VAVNRTNRVTERHVVEHWDLGWREKVTSVVVELASCSQGPKRDPRQGEIAFRIGNAEALRSLSVTLSERLSTSGRLKEFQAKVQLRNRCLGCRAQRQVYIGCGSTAYLDSLSDYHMKGDQLEVQLPLPRLSLVCFILSGPRLAAYDRGCTQW